MKRILIALAVLCGTTMFSAESIKFNTKPGHDRLESGKAISHLRIMPENLKENKFYRVSMQIKLKQTDIMVCRTYRGETGGGAGWGRTTITGPEWQKYCQYIAPGNVWTYYSIGVKTRGNSFLVKDIKIEELDEQDLTSNLLLPLKEMGWHNAWSANEAKIGFEKSEDSPFGAEVLTAEVNEGTGHPAILAIPVIPGRTLLLDMWVKGEPDEVWMATVSNSGSTIYPVKNEWSRQELKIKIKAKEPTVAKIVFWKPKNRKQLKCSFAKLEARYEKQDHSAELQ